MFDREQPALKPGARFLVVVGSCFDKKALDKLELAVGNHHCAGEVALLLVLTQGITDRQCLKRCAN
jgi:hypothetical protein